MMAEIIFSQGLVDRVDSIVIVEERIAARYAALEATEKEWPVEVQPEVKALLQQIGSINAALDQLVIFGGVEAPAYRRVHGEGRAVRLRHAPLWVSSKRPARLEASRREAFEKLARLADGVCAPLHAKRAALMEEALNLLKKLGVSLQTEENVWAVAELARAELRALYAKSDIGAKSRGVSS